MGRRRHSNSNSGQDLLYFGAPAPSASSERPRNSARCRPELCPLRYLGRRPERVQAVPPYDGRRAVEAVGRRAGRGNAEPIDQDARGRHRPSRDRRSLQFCPSKHASPLMATRLSQIGPYAQQLVVELSKLWETLAEASFKTSILVTMTKLIEVRLFARGKLAYPDGGTPGSWTKFSAVPRGRLQPCQYGAGSDIRGADLSARRCNPSLAGHRPPSEHHDGGPAFAPPFTHRVPRERQRHAQTGSPSAGRILPLGRVGYLDGTSSRCDRDREGAGPGDAASARGRDG